MDFHVPVLERIETIGRDIIRKLKLLVASLSGSSSTGNNTATPTASYTGTAELNTAPDVMVSCYSDDQAGTLYFDFSVNGTDWRPFPVRGFNVSAGIHEFHVAVKGPRYFRVRFATDSGVAPTTLQLYTYFGVFGAPNSPINQAISSDADALTVRPTDYDEEVGLGLRGDKDAIVKFGRNPDIGTATDPEDAWNGGGDFTGHDGTANEEIAVVSSSTADVGALVSSGTATGGSSTTLIDTGATFSTDGVAVGDCVINTTDDSVGFVKTVDSETQLTVHKMAKGDLNALGLNESGDSYQVITASSTGAAVIRLTRVLDIAFTAQPNVYMIMNGQTTVTTSGVTAARCSRIQVIHAGSGEANAGTITANQASTTANVYGVITADYSQTVTCADSVPADKRALIKKIEITCTRTGGAAGVATCALRARQYKGPWRNLLVFDIQAGTSKDYNLETGILIPGFSDFKIRCLEVSSNNTIVDATMSYKFIDEDQIA